MNVFCFVFKVIEARMVVVAVVVAVVVVVAVAVVGISLGITLALALARTLSRSSSGATNGDPLRARANCARCGGPPQQNSHQALN